MTVGELYRVITEGTRIEIIQNGSTYFNGIGAQIPMILMDASIESISPYYDTLKIMLCE